MWKVLSLNTFRQKAKKPLQRLLPGLFILIKLQVVNICAAKRSELPARGEPLVAVQRVAAIDDDRILYK